MHDKPIEYFIGRLATSALWNSPIKKIDEWIKFFQETTGTFPHPPSADSTLHGACNDIRIMWSRHLQFYLTRICMHSIQLGVDCSRERYCRTEPHRRMIDRLTVLCTFLSPYLSLSPSLYLSLFLSVFVHNSICNPPRLFYNWFGFEMSSVQYKYC